MILEIVIVFCLKKPFQTEIVENQLALVWELDYPEKREALAIEIINEFADEYWEVEEYLEE